VIDNGPGVPRSEIGSLKKRFSRLESSRSTPGHGLGLSLVSAIAKLHDGRLILEGRGGFCAMLELPLKEAA
jgi:signal transduction histidine kinase